MKKILPVLIILAITALISYFPVRTITKIKAKCDQCLCVNAPTCSDVVVVQRGAPFASSYTLVESEYVEEPYKSQYANKMIPINIQ